jgi:predicted GNAT superfamily acetyltransferase
VAEWHLSEPAVVQRIAASGRQGATPAAPVLNPSHGTGERLEPGPSVLDSSERRLMVEIPMGFSDIQTRDPDLALAWRLATRRIFQTYLPKGYRVVDFLLSRAIRRGHYVLAQGPGTQGGSSLNAKTRGQA